MKLFFKIFFRVIRILLGPVILLLEMITTPKGITRTQEQQQRLDQRTENLVLYQYKTCPFCVKVRRAIASLSLNIETRDTQRDPIIREQLLQGGGQIKVPCLKVTDKNGAITWMYESDRIVQYLQESFTYMDVGKGR